MIELITFTGVDDNTDLEWAEELAKTYPRIEFGILVGTKTKPTKDQTTANRFPCLKTIAAWKKVAANCRINLALHLCGKYQRQVNSGDISQKLLDLCDGFNRVQVNAVKYDAGNVAKFVEAVPVQSVILQHRSTFNRNLPIQDNPRVEYLFDKSGGRGKNTLNEWPGPTHRFRCGYAGGIQRTNINVITAFGSKWYDYRLWFDMESGVRSHLDWFDLSEVTSICFKLCGDRDNYEEY